MSKITMGGNTVHTIGEMPEKGKELPDFSLVRKDLSAASLNDFKGKRVVMNIFPSVDTGVCATSVRKFNERASELNNTAVLCISRDLPFAQARFCGAEGLDRVEMLSDFRNGEFGKKYGVELTDGPFQNLHARAVIVADENGKVIHSQLVNEIGEEPNYDSAIEALK